MATKKNTSAKKASSSGSDPKSKAIVQKKVGEVMHEFKEGDLNSGGGKNKVKNPKQAIAIALSEARRAGAKIPPPPAAKKATGKKAAPKKSSKPASSSKTNNRK